MRTLAFFLLISASAAGQPRLTPQDDAEIRAAIDALAKRQNENPSGQVWSERGPVVYAVQRITGLTANVATADATGSRTGAFPTMQHYVFLLTRTAGSWRVARTIPACQAMKMMPISDCRYRSHSNSSP